MQIKIAFHHIRNKHGLGQRGRKSRRLHMCFHLSHPSGINWVAVLNICKEASRSV